MKKLSSIEEQLLHYITYISDSAQDTNREDWKNEYANMHTLIRLDNINRLCYELLEQYKNEQIPVTWYSYNELFSTVKEFVDCLKGRGTPLKDAYGLGELFVYMSMNINMTRQENKEISDLDFSETLYLKAKEVGGINDPWFLYQEPQDAQTTLLGIKEALKYARELVLIYKGKADGIPDFAGVAEKALNVLTKITAYKGVNSYPYVSAYIALVNVAYYSRRLKEIDVMFIEHELELMHERLQQYLSNKTKEVYLESLPATIPPSEPTKTGDEKDNTKSAGISLDFFKKD